MHTHPTQKIVDEIIYKVPAIALGSYEAVEAWCRDRDGRRSRYAEQKEKEYTWRCLKEEVHEKVIEGPPF